MFVGGNTVDEDQSKTELEARLVESENMVRHYETVVRNRDQELNITKRVSKAADIVISKVWCRMGLYWAPAHDFYDRAYTFHLFR